MTKRNEMSEAPASGLTASGKPAGGEWIYENSADNRARYILGESGTRPLVCIGINPSTAEPDKLDPTLRAVKAWSKRLGFDGWIMLNLYPLRATNPDDLPEIANLSLHELNLSKIARCLSGYEGDLSIWAAWGNLITKRPYLIQCFTDVLGTVEINVKIVDWFTVGPKSKLGHPHHPLYLSAKCTPETFYPHLYLRDNQEDER